MKNIAEIKNALRDIVDYYQHPPKNFEALINKYADGLSRYPIDSVKLAIRTIAMDAGRFFPTLSEIRALIGNSGPSEKAEGCQWCENGRIFATHRENKMNFVFKCQCKAGAQLGASCPTWNSSKYSPFFERLR